MLHILVHTDISMKFWYCISVTFVLQIFFGLAAYPQHHVIILVQITQLMLNIITQISVVGDRQLKYSAFIPILPWSALGNSSHVLIQRSNPSSLCNANCVQLHKINVISIHWMFSFTVCRCQIQYHDSHNLKCNLTSSHLHGRIITDCNCILMHPLCLSASQFL